MLLWGYFFLKALIAPLPVTWFGKHPNGCIHTIFGAPLSISSIISPVKNQPSPVWLPIETTSLALSARCSIEAGGAKRFDFSKALIISFLKKSTALTANSHSLVALAVALKCFLSNVVE